MLKLKIAVAVIALVVATLAPSLRLIPADSLLGWSLQPVTTYACDPGSPGGCGG
jgi:hypothetical protein